jgi:hypothetical protein
VDTHDYLSAPDEQPLVDWTKDTPTDAVISVMQILSTMTDSDRARMQREMGIDE